MDTAFTFEYVCRVCSEALRNWSYAFMHTPISDIVASTSQLRELTPQSLALRLLLAVIFGGMIGMERGRKNRPAGFRTYMVVCVGATLTMILGQYELQLVESVWASQSALVGAKVDVSRFGAQVINGVGFLGAGTILITGRQQIKGLTTAASLWASACMGLAVGAGFYEAAAFVVVLMLVATLVLPKIEALLIEKARNMNIYVEIDSLEVLNKIIVKMKSMDIHIYEVDIERGAKAEGKSPNAVLSIRLPKHKSHTQIMAALTELKAISVMEEL